MAEALVQDESPVEYFRDLVESAMQRQHLSAREGTSFYLVNLLAGFVHGDRTVGRATTSRSACDSRRRCRKQARGSATSSGRSAIVSLFISGFFADSLSRSLVDVDYYIQLGEHAYGSLARQADEHVRRRVRRARRQVPGVRRRARRGERAHGDDVERRPASPVREVAADAKPAGAGISWRRGASFPTRRSAADSSSERSRRPPNNSPTRRAERGKSDNLSILRQRSSCSRI